MKSWLIDLTVMFLVSMLFMFWSVSFSPSLLLMILLAVVLIESSLMSFLIPPSKMNVMIITLTFCGGLFILISLTIMCMPTDQFSIKSVITPISFTFSTMLTILFYLFKNYVHIKTYSEFNWIQSSMSVSGVESWGFIFLLLVLLFMLKIIDFMSIKEGTMFKDM